MLIFFTTIILKGIWYLIQKINHTGNTQYNSKKRTCPVIHISEYKGDFGTSYDSKEMIYRTRYGTEYYRDRSYSSLARETIYKDNQNRYKHMGYGNQSVAQPIRLRNYFGTKYLRMYWDDDGHSMEYNFHYDSRKTALWFGANFEDFASPARLTHNPFPSNIQVIKAVGDHLVLTFCYSSPYFKQFFTAILSRSDHLDFRHIQGIHWLLASQRLPLYEVENYCNKSVLVQSSLFLSLCMFGLWMIVYKLVINN